MKSNFNSVKDLAGKKILFANFPADGHFNPLTGLAVHLQSLGCDVRWYTSNKYAEKLSSLNIRHYPFNKAMDVSDVENVFPERNAIKGKVAKLNFDIVHAFILRGPEYYADLIDIYKRFSFDVMVADCAFTGIPFVTDKMDVPVVSIGVLPLPETSRDLAPYGLGMTPSYSFLGKIRQRLLRYAANKFLFRRPNQVMKEMLDAYGIDYLNLGVFDLMIKKSDLVLQSGTPSFEYYRSDLGKNVRFIGSVLPYQSLKKRQQWFDKRLTEFEKIVIVTQGTIERDIEKLLVPTLDAFKNSEILVIATTGGSGTDELRKKFPQSNIIIEDFIPFTDIMPYADVYITNGGYGGVMLAIENRLPLVVAGVHEGKNEINARIGYFGLGVNLGTETPKPNMLRKTVSRVLKDNSYEQNVVELAKEFDGYNPNYLTEYYIKEVLNKSGRVYFSRQEENIY